MSDEASVQPPAVSAPADTSVARPADPPTEAKEPQETTSSNGVETAKSEEMRAATVKTAPEPSIETPKLVADKPAEIVETKDEVKEDAPAPIPAPEPVTEVGAKVDATDAAPTDALPAAEASADAETGANKSKSARRKSSGVPEHKSKKLNKKASKAKMNHIDAKPGEHYFIRLKGYPPWPGIVCDEAMLPQTLLKSRPVTAARPDGTYRADFEDGGKKVNDRTFPVMYLSTNEFGWIPNYDLEDLDTETVGDVQEGKMRKDLYHAHKLAAENHNLDHYKQVLQDFQDALQAELEAKAEAKAAKAAKAANKGKRKSKAAAEVNETNEDVEMEDAAADEDGDEDKPKSAKKRKAATDADDNTTGTEPAKKPKIKLTTTPKTNGNATPKSSSKKDQPAKVAKPPKASKAKNGAGSEAAAPAPQEPEPTPEEKRLKKEKEILFLRHKLQKGLLTRDQQPKEEEMKQMSEFITKLEGYAELEVSIIRATKINKVLKAILKLEEIPKEAEFKFKDRSQVLLSKWNKILESETPAPAGTSAVPEPSTNGSATKELENGVSAKTEEKEPDTTEPESKEQEKKDDVTTSNAVIADTIMKDVEEKDVPAIAPPPADDAIKPVETETAVETAS